MILLDMNIDIGKNHIKLLPPPRSYAQSMTRYRNYYKVEYIKLKDGRKVKVGGWNYGNRISKGDINTNEDTCIDNIGCLLIIIICLFGFLFIIII